MRKRSDPPPTGNPVDDLLGLGAFSARKSYYPALLEKIAELEKLNSDLDARVQRRTQELEESLQALKDTQRQLVQAEKMASLGQLVAGIAHEINTPVGTTLTAVSLLYDRLNELDIELKSRSMTRSSLQEALEITLEASASSLINLKRVAELVSSFKQVAVDQTQQVKRELDLSAYLHELLTTFRIQTNAAGHRIELSAPDQLIVFCDPGLITQILSGLISNALTHAFSNTTQGQIDVRLAISAGTVELQVADNGDGMPPETLSRIFDPFFTTSRGQGSSGLGLHILYNLVTQALGGRVECDSQIRQGTVFTISFPQHSA